MANHCYNFITVEGSEEDIEILKDVVMNSKKAFANISYYNRLRDEFNGTEDDPGWFEIEDPEFYPTSVTFQGDSSWSPAIELFAKISDKLSSLNIHYEYEESGNNFSGVAAISDGVCLDNCMTYWVGQVFKDAEFAFSSAIENELEYFEDKETLLNSAMYQAFDIKHQKILLKTWKKYHETTNK